MKMTTWTYRTSVRWEWLQYLKPLFVVPEYQGTEMSPQLYFTVTVEKPGWGFLIILASVLKFQCLN